VGEASLHCMPTGCFLYGIFMKRPLRLSRFYMRLSASMRLNTNVRDATRLAGFGGQLRREHPVLDVILLALGLGFFALSIAYAFACERL
jgi:hypothetical protein